MFLDCPDAESMRADSLNQLQACKAFVGEERSQYMIYIYICYVYCIHIYSLLNHIPHGNAKGLKTGYISLDIFDGRR